MLTDEVARPVDEPGLGEPGHVVVRERRGSTVADDWIGEAVPLDEASGIAAEVLGVDPDHDKPRRPVPLRCCLEQRRLLPAGNTPRCPEVQDDCSPTQRAEPQLTFVVQARKREIRCGWRLAGGKRVVKAASAAVRDELQPEQEKQQHNDRQANRLK